MFRSAFFRNIFAIVLISTIETLLMILVVNIENNTVRILLIVFAFVFGALSALLYAYINAKLTTQPLRAINEVTDKLAKGEYGVRIDEINMFDNDVKATSIGFNTIATQFENLEQMRKQFVSNASHELRSPLTSIQGFLQAILDGTIQDQDKRKYLEIVLSETKRLSTMSQSMLDLSSMESGRSTLTFSRFDIIELLKQIGLRFEPNFLAKQITLYSNFAKNQIYVYADKDKITQVLINLVDNAIKYSPLNSKITLAAHTHTNKVYISVKDTGVGISKKDQVFIWDRFYMGDRARTPGKGTGLGLSIVKKIVDDHREVIWVESNRGAGSTFIFTLPVFDQSKHSIL